VQVKWETREVTYEPLDIIATDATVTCAVYARDNDLLDLATWLETFQEAGYAREATPPAR